MWAVAIVGAVFLIWLIVKIFSGRKGVRYTTYNG